jgi:hypothetical protein
MMRSTDDYPIADERTFCVLWQGKECYLGNKQLFWVMKLLLEARGGYISYDDIAEGLGKELMRPDAIRKNLERLRTALKDSACQPLVPCIVVDNQMVKVDISKVKTVCQTA